MAAVTENPDGRSVTVGLTVGVAGTVADGLEGSVRLAAGCAVQARRAIRAMHERFITPA